MARDISRITTEREYGRMVGGGAAGVAGAVSTGGAPAIPAAVSSTGSASAPASPPPAFGVRGLAIGAGVAAAIGAAFFALRGRTPDPTPPTQAASKPPSAAAPAPGPRPAPASPAAPPGSVSPEPAHGGKNDDPVPAPAATDPEASLTGDEREEIADAKKTLLDLISFGSRVSPEDLESEDASLPEVKGTDLPGARAAVERSLELWKAGKGAEVAARIPEALLPSIAKPLEVPPASVRGLLAERTYAPIALSSFRTGKAVAVGGDWVLVRYDAVDADGDAASAVAVCVRERGVWKVFL